MRFGTSGTERMRIEQCWHSHQALSARLLVLEGQQVEIIEPVVRKSGQFLAQGHITLVIIFLHSNGRFTAPVAGVYFFAATPAYKQSSITFNWYFRVNGSVVSEPVRLIGALNTHSTVSGSLIIKLNASDYVDISVTEPSPRKYYL